MGVWRRLTGAALVAGAAGAALTRILRTRPPVLPPPPPGDPRRFAWRHADLFAVVRGQGPPALLLHDLYTGAGSHEMTDLGERLAGDFSVHALDLPGFGRSGKPRMRYRPELLADAIVEYVRHAIGAPTLLVASGLAGSAAALAAARLGPEAAGLVLSGPPEPGAGPAPNGALYQLLRSPAGELYHHLHATAPWRRQALGSLLAAPPADLDERADRLHRYASQPGAEWALWSLWSGDLSEDPRPVLAGLDAPVLLLWGAETRGDPAAPEAYRAARADLDQRVLPGTARWPHLDDPDGVAEAIRAWRA